MAFKLFLGNSPTSIISTIGATVDNLTLTDLNASVNAAKNTQATTEALTFTDNPVTVSYGKTINVVPEVNTINNLSLNVNAAKNISTNVDPVAFSDYPVTITTTGDLQVNASTQILNLTDFPVTISYGQSSGSSGGYYKRSSYKRSYSLSSLDEYEKRVKELLEEEQQEEEKLKKLETKLHDKQITVLLNLDPEIDQVKSQQKIVSTQLEIIKVKSEINKTQNVLNRIEKQIEKTERLKFILKDDEEFLKHYLKVS